MRITRRDFIKGAAVALLTLEGARLLKPPQAGYEIVETTRELMGTSARITLLTRNKNRAQEATNQAFTRMHRVDRLMSIYREDSEISMLNEHGYYGGLSPETAQVIREANHYSELSDGAFDISILPILDSATEKTSTSLVGYKNIILEGRNIRFMKRGMKITLGGIGIGHALDSAIEVLKSYDLESGMINIGGDIRTIGDTADGISWKIGVEDPADRSDFISTIDLKDKAVATSGNYQKLHIKNPKTGTYPNGLLSATIIAASALEADAVSTTVFVLGLDKGMEFINSIEGVEGLFVTNKHTILKSKGFKNFEIPSHH